MLSNWSVSRLHYPRTALSDTIIGAGAGALTSVVCQPVDVLRTRLVGQGQIKVYHGFAHGVQRILLDEGPLALWRGLAPSLILIVPQTAIAFATYEELKRFFKSSTSK